MGKIALVFAGQGAQYPGMGKSLYEVSAAARAVFDLAERLRPGTLTQCFEGTKEELTVTRNTQPCMFAVELAAAAALYHDAPEILTGDLPTPVKYYNPEIRDAYKRVEEISAQKLLSMLPEGLRPAYAPLLREDCGAEIQAVVKAADKLSAYIKCVEELKAGNAEFKQAEEQTRAILEQSTLPEVGYFMEHFMPAFGLTLDELQ